MPLQPVILSGGSGTRLWPLSREAYPKQFLPLTGSHTMLQETVRRLDGLENEHPRQAIGLSAPILVCNQDHRFLVAEQLRQIARQPAAIILEPVGRNTAPALELAALEALRDGADPVLLVMPADHCIRDGVGFRAAVADAYALAADGLVVTFGIVPGGPETGYGYLRRGAAVTGPGVQGAVYRLSSFAEKPDRETAQAYLDAGDAFWNSGLFVLKASVWHALLERFRPDIAAAVGRAHANRRADGDFLRIDEDAFRACPGDSIDYAVMERLLRTEPAGAGPLPEVMMIPLDIGWSDVGAWPALWEVRDQDGDGNVLDGDARAFDAQNNLVLAQHRMVAAVGVRDLIVVETPDAVLVAAKDKAQEVKAVTQFLRHEQRNEYRHHQRVHRPWGSYESIGQGARYQVKRLIVNPGESLSLQMHHHRAEHWVVVSGTARVTCDERVFPLTENHSTFIPVGSTHRLENPGTIPLQIIEVQSGSYLGEDDIVRFEDRYNREATESG